ncbi:sugar-binding protein [Aestuariibaculum sediminum]|uniref:Endoxylanase n=1 Tax=Aestuariibaculum sediminum TaxID=2770637 RepID=A0A8J6Q968_9FLAO|nr:sugar-binding protein [Aestuariibaculum sediminum]MBD0833330.1 endoxylanase [Aestuariibaculum sediminum]
MKQYFVKSINKQELKLDGTGNHALWDQANVLTDFSSPWDTSDVKKIEFKALYNETHLLVCFKVFDEAVYLDLKGDNWQNIANSDRVELFFRKDENLSPYYCLEIDPSPRVLDFIAYPNRNFDYSWRWPDKHLLVKSNIEQAYFAVEKAISLESLKQLGLLKSGKLEVGVYRAKYNKSTLGLMEPTWITWVNPNTETPNFHVASSFGEFILEDLII